MFPCEIKSKLSTLAFSHNLRILGLIETDAGMFQCIGTNPAGSIQAAARLEIATPSKYFFCEKINICIEIAAVHQTFGTFVKILKS